MKYNLSRKIIIAIILLVTLLSLDILLCLTIYNQFYYSNLLFQLNTYLFLLAFVFLFKSNKYSLIYSIIVSLLYSLLVFINLALYTASDDIFSLRYIFLFKTATGVFTSSYIPWKILGIFAIYYLSIAGLYVLGFKITKNKSSNLLYHPQLISVTMLFLLIFTRVGLLSALEKNYSSIEIYDGMNGTQIISFQSQTQKKNCLRNYGLLTYEIGEINQIISPVESKYIDDNKGEISFCNEYKFPKYNVITIMVETGCSFLINEELTPNIYNLSTDSLNFINSISKNKTNVSEFIGITGSGTDINSVMSGKLKNKYSLPNILKKEGYLTQFFHDNDKGFYNREIEMYNLGFDKCYFANDVNPEVIEDIYKWNGSYPLDSEFIELVIDDMIPNKSDKPFYSFYTTFSMHGPYDRNGKNYQKFIDLGYYKKLEEAKENNKWENICSDDSEEIQKQIEYLQCAMMDFDYTLGRIIERLKDTNQYDNTIIAIYGDHDAYYKSNNYGALKEYVYDTTNYYDPKQYSIITMISNPELARAYRNYSIACDNIITFGDFVSPYIIVPTILDILGIEYQQNNYFGTSIFRTTSIYDNIFYSHELGIYLSHNLSASSLGVYGYDNDTTDEEKKLFEEALVFVIQKIYYFDISYRNNEFAEE